MEAIAKTRGSNFQPPRHPIVEIASICADGCDYQLIQLVSIEQILSIKPQWRALEQATSDRFDYFQSFDWCYQWCLTKFGQDRKFRDAELSIYALRCDDTIVMIWPMMVVKTRIGAKILTMLTDPLEQYANVLFDKKQVSAAVGRETWKVIRQHAEVDAITFNHYPNGSFLDEVLSKDGFVERDFSEASILDLTAFESWDDHHASLSRNQRKQRNRRRSNLRKLGEVTYEVHFGGCKTYAESVKIALEMKQVWLAKTGRKPGILAEPDTETFLVGLTGTEVGPLGCPDGAFVQTLCVNRNPVALEIGMVKGRHYYSYLGAFDWALRDYSPGKVQIEAAQEWANSVGLEMFDFLGDSSDYKKQWAGASQTLLSRSMPVTALGLPYCAIWKSRLRPQLKHAYKNLNPDNRKVISKAMTLVRRSSAGDSSDRDTELTCLEKHS